MKMKYKYLLTLIFVILVQIFKLSAQTLPEPKVESPNVASLGRFGETPVSYFTGVPDLAIPIYAVSSGSIKVPISLKYHPGSVRISQHPGWVGMGWNLQSIGSITRTKRSNLGDDVDEYYSSNSFPANNEKPYYPSPITTGLTGSEEVHVSNWDDPGRLTDYFSVSSINPVSSRLKVVGDEYSFNFLGYTGKFYYGGPSIGWEVVCDQKVKVQLNSSPDDFLTPAQISTIIQQYQPFETGVMSSSQSRMFSGFTITTPDGVKYIFGGGDAIEFTSEYGAATYNFTANSWLLKKIIDPQNNSIEFAYERSYPVCQLSMGLTNISGSCTQGSGIYWHISSGQSYSSQYVDPNVLGGHYIWPMYLKSISGQTEQVVFSRTPATCLRYTDAQLTYRDNSGSGNSNPYNLNLLKNRDINHIKWEKLDNIKILRYGNGSSGIIRQFDFSYSSSASQRLTLNNFSIKDANGSLLGKYDFEYYNPESLPSYTGNFSDHWGFYNFTDISYTQKYDIFNKKNTNVGAVTTGLIKNIKYPTGGSSVFYWEAHDYSQVVGLDRSGLVNSVGYAGGSRIREVKSYSAEGNLTDDRKYYYKRGFNGTDPNSLPSSGVLNGIPQYALNIIHRPDAFTNSGSGSWFDIYVSTLFAGGNYSYNGEGSYIGYDEVAEVNTDGSYTKNFFTSYGTDINNVSHFDIAPTGTKGWINGTDTYIPTSSLEAERGKLVGTYIYSSANTLLKKTNIQYRNDAARFNNFIKIIDFHGSYGSNACPASALIFAAARKQFTYNYYPVTKTITSYDQNGNNPVTETTAFTYNSDNLVATETTTTSKGEVLVTTNKYPSDYPSDPIYVGMKNANIITPLIESSVSKAGNILTLSSIEYYSPFSGLYLPKEFKRKNGTSNIETVQQVNLYDQKGNILEIQKPNNLKESYIWGYNSQYIVAKITGSDYATAQSLIDQTKLNNAASGTYTEMQIREELNKLRTGLPNAFVTTYTYKTGFGVSTITDEIGRVTFYDYDALGRLMLVRDFEGKIIKKICYSLSGLQENCSFFGNELQSQTFTRTNCGTDYVGTTGTYQIPANTYFSAINVADANAMALSDISDNGQNYVNNNPASGAICLPLVKALNSTTIPYYLTLTPSGGTASTYSVYPNTVSTQVCQLQPGTYSIQVTPYSAGYSTQIKVNGVVYTGTSFSIPGYAVTTPLYLEISTEASSGPCSFTINTGFTNLSSNISSSGGSASGYLAFYSSGSMYPGTSYKVATINGGCRPSGTRTFTTTSGGRTWNVTVYANGDMYAQIAYGSSTLPPYSSASLSISYSL